MADHLAAKIDVGLADRGDIGEFRGKGAGHDAQTAIPAGCVQRRCGGLCVLSLLCALSSTVFFAAQKPPQIVLVASNDEHRDGECESQARPGAEVKQP